jgi:hypothetical protein
MRQDAFCASVARHLSEFEEASGHRVDVQLIDNDEYFTNELAPYLDGEDPADVYMSGPVLMWEQLGAGHVEPLDSFLGYRARGKTILPSRVRSPNELHLVAGSASAV